MSILYLQVFLVHVYTIPCVVDISGDFSVVLISPENCLLDKVLCSSGTTSSTGFSSRVFVSKSEPFKVDGSFCDSTPLSLNSISPTVACTCPSDSSVVAAELSFSSDSLA